MMVLSSEDLYFPIRAGNFANILLITSMMSMDIEILPMAIGGQKSILWGKGMDPGTAQMLELCCYASSKDPASSYILSFTGVAGETSTDNIHTVMVSNYQLPAE
jgi:hypothetical protein